MAVTGGCLCGAVRFSFPGEPLGSRVCWCRLCQYLGAGSGTVNVIFHREGMTVSGDLRDYASTADSGNRMHRHFCPTCGTPVFSAAEIRPTVVIVRAGTLDNPELAPPTSTIWTSAAPSWACLDPALPQLPGQPPPVL